MSAQKTEAKPAPKVGPMISALIGKISFISFPVFVDLLYNATELAALL